MIYPILSTGFQHDKVSSGFLYKLKFYEISSSVFAITLPFFSNRRLGVVLDGTYSYDYAVNDGVPQGSNFGLTLLLLYINDLLDGAICNIAIFADDNTLYFKCAQASDL